MAATLTTTDPYANVRKRATSQLYAADPSMTIDAPAPDPQVGSPDFKPSGEVSSSPDEGVLGLKSGPPGDPNATPGMPSATPRVGVPVPQPNYSMAAPQVGDYQPTDPPPYIPPTSQAPTVARTTMDSAQSNASAGGDEAAVRGFYTKWLGRDALADDPQKWLSGAYGHGTDLATIENAIRNSDEAQQYAKKNGGGAGGSGDPVYDATLQNYQALGAQPTGPGSGPTDIAYFIRRINETGGLTEANKAYWFGQNGRIAKELRHEVPPETGGGGTPSAAPPAPYTPPSTGPTAPAGNTAFQDEIRKQIMERLKSAGMPVDENSAGITDAVASARDEATRSGAQERTALAERLYAQGGGGLDTNALTQQIQQSGEKTAASTGGIRATMIMQEYGRKQQELDQLLSMATASGDAEAARNIQLYMAELQAQLQREGISADLAKYAAYLDQNAALAGLRG